MTSNSTVDASSKMLLKPSLFGQKFITPHQKYQRELQENCYVLTQKFPTLSAPKIKSFLEEFNNDTELVEKLLSQEAPKRDSGFKKEVALQSKIKTPEDEIKILKRAVTSLFSKLQQKTKQCEKLEITNENLQKERNFFKNRSQLLSEKKICNNFDEILDIF